MPIFSLRDVKLEPISEIPVNLEIEIQRMVEKNISTLFGLEFVSAEFILNDLRIALDEEFSINLLAFAL